MWGPTFRGGKRIAAIQALYPALGGIGVGLGFMGTGSVKGGLVIVALFSALTVLLIVIIKRERRGDAS